VLEQYLRQYPAEGIMAAACRVGRLALQLAERESVIKQQAKPV